MTVIFNQSLPTVPPQIKCPPLNCAGSSPICASDGISTLSRSFDSPCELQRYMCATGKGLMQTSDPSCLIPNEPPAAGRPWCRQRRGLAMLFVFFLQREPQSSDSNV
jgi:hypothetical protein